MDRYPPHPFSRVQFNLTSGYITYVTIAYNSYTGWWFQTQARARIHSSFGGLFLLNFGRFVSFAMASEWDRLVELHSLFTPKWEHLERGTSISLVVDCLVFTDEMIAGVTIPDQRKMRLYGDINREVRGCRRLTLLDVLADPSPDGVNLLITDASAVVAHGLRPATEALWFVELCSGIACSGLGLSEVGFSHLASMEWKPNLAALHRLCHPSVPVLVSDVTCPSSAKELLQQFDPPFSIMSGFSCQPYSSGGAQLGSGDDRSSTLPATIRMGYLCQSPLLILECVAPARCHQYVQAHLKLLETALGYHVTQICLKLEDVWASRRFRWWVVATHPSLGKVDLPEWPKTPHLVVRDLLPGLKQWGPDAEHELQLPPVEVERFTLDGSHMRKYLIQKDGKLPTCLHSWGSQATSCPCGCRQAGFTDALIRQRGIYAQVFQQQTPDGTVSYRHVHPVELALLNGMIPPHAWLEGGPIDLRLCLCAVGQLASPLQAIWVGGCAITHMQHAFGMPVINPAEVLATYRRKLFQVAQDLFHVSLPASVALSKVEIHHPDGTVVHVQVSESTTLSELHRAEVALTKQDIQGLWCDAHSGDCIAEQALVAGRCIRILPQGPDPRSSSSADAVPFDLTDDLLDAIPLDFSDLDVFSHAPETSEAGLGLHVGDDSRHAVAPDASEAGLPGVSEHTPICRMTASVASEAGASGVGMCPCPEPAYARVEHPALPTPCDVFRADVATSLPTDALLGLRSLTGEQMATLILPIVRDGPTCLHMRQQAVTSSTRLDLLHKQHKAMGDDEINLHAHACLAIANDPSIAYLDPLLASSWLKLGVVAEVQNWLAQYPDAKRVATVVHFQDHWMPVVWTKGLTEVQVSMWEHDDMDISGLFPLHGLVSQAWQLPRFALACTRRSFGRDYCGTAAVAHLASQLIDAAAPQTDEQLKDLHRALRATFAEAVHNLGEVPKPWCWGLGVPALDGSPPEPSHVEHASSSLNCPDVEVIYPELTQYEALSAVTCVHASSAAVPTSEAGLPMNFDCQPSCLMTASVASEAGASVLEVGWCPVPVYDKVECKSLSPITVAPAAAAADPPRDGCEDCPSPLRSCTSHTLPNMPPASDPCACQCLHFQAVPSHERLELLNMQQTAMGDDEIHFHASACLDGVCTPHDAYLDPLIASAWVRSGNVAEAQTWLEQHPEVTRVATVVHLHEHWIPMVWTKGTNDVQVSMWEHDAIDIRGLLRLHDLMCRAWKKPPGAVDCQRRSFGHAHCGAAAVAFLAHKLLHTSLPNTAAQLSDFHEKLRTDFAAAIYDQVSVPMPRCWGWGAPDDSITAELLQKHGVPHQLAMSRAKLIVQSIGKQDVQKAVTGVSPWKSLKALANQQKPVLQLVLPDEVAQKPLAKQPAAKGSKQAKNEHDAHTPCRPRPHQAVAGCRCIPYWRR